MRLTLLPGTPRRGLLSFDRLEAARAERLAGAGAAGELLHIALDYTPPDGEFGHGAFRASFTFSDGAVLGSAGELLPLVLPADRSGVALEPEVVASTAAAIARSTHLRVSGVHLEPRETDRLFGRGDTRSGVALVDCRGDGWDQKAWWTVGKPARGSCPVYHGGHILGRAGTEGGADQAGRAGRYAFPVQAEHGWRLQQTAAGRFWTVRPADDVAHRIRTIRQDLEAAGARLDELAALDLSDEPERAQELLDLLEVVAARGDAIRAAARLPPPKRRKAAKASETVVG